MIIGEPLVTPQELADRLGETFSDAATINQAKAFIAEASARVRAAGSAGWTRTNVPEIAYHICLAAAARGFLNPAGIDSERADSLQITRSKAATSGTELTELERSELAAAAASSRGGIFSIPITRGDIATSDRTIV